MKKIVLYLLIFTTSCSLFGSRDSVMDKPDCELPCWKNITPGLTAYSDALQIIPSLEGVDSNTVEPLSAPWEIFSQRIWFHHSPYSSNVKDQTDGNLYFLDSKVALLMLDRNINRTFGDMFKITGEPEFVFSIPFPRGPSIMAISPSKGIVYSFLAQSGDLEPTTKIETVILFDPARYIDLLDAGMFSWSEWNGEETLKMAYPWKGYGRVDELYPVKYP